MPAQDKEFFPAGVVTGVHGLRGDLKVKPNSGEPDTLLNCQQVRLVAPGGTPTEYPIVCSRLHKDRVLLRLGGLENINLVEHLKGAEIHCRFEDLVELEQDEFYWYQIEGMRVEDQTLGELGTLESYFTTAAHDTWVVQGPFGEVLVPAVPQFIVGIDPHERVVLLDLPEGLVETDNA